jgi:hypothetical protein
MPSAQKKVIVRRFAGDLLAGYLPLAGLVRGPLDSPNPDPSHSAPRWLDLLDLGGRIVPLPLDDIKTVSYVRDFNLNDTVHPERLSRRTFLARPRTEGLWLRLTFRSGDLLEGLAPLDLSLLTHAIEDAGLHLTPPDIRSNTQRIFVPRSAIADLQLLAVITTPSRRKPLDTSLDAQPDAILQETLFK